MDAMTLTVSAIYAGHMSDPKKGAAVGLANVCLNILIDSFMLGLNSA